MIEKIILDYLREELSVPVYAEKEPDMPEEYVLIEKTGSTESDYIKNSMLVVQSYSMSLYKAAELNEAVKETMKQSIQLDDVSRCSLNSDYNFTDTSGKAYRYQAVFDIVHY